MARGDERAAVERVLCGFPELRTCVSRGSARTKNALLRINQRKCQGAAAVDIL